METKTNNYQNKGQQDKEPQPQKSWIERNLWLIAIGIAIFCLRMCHDLAR